MIHSMTLLTIVLMAGATYLTRVIGYVVLRNRTLSRRATAVLLPAPGCVLIAVIAPDFVSTQPADLLAITLVAATRLPILPTVLIGIVAAGVLRRVIP